MELKFFLSGVPMGENLWGDKLESPYFSTLYVPSRENFRFDIRLRKNGDKIYAYYHYLVYNIINDSDGRDGSYIGLTVRLDSYCSDFKTIYEVLDIIFNKKIVGSFLKWIKGDRLQYTCQLFDKKSAELAELEKTIRNLLGTLLQTSDFRTIPKMPSNHGCLKFNYEDATEKKIMDAVGQTGECSISLEYDSQKTIKKIKEAFESGSASKQHEISSLNVQIKSLLDKENEYLSKIKELEEKTKLPVTNQPVRNVDYEEDIFAKKNSDIWSFLGKLLLFIDIVFLGVWAFYSLSDSEEDSQEAVVIDSSQFSEMEDADKKVLSLKNLEEDCPRANLSVSPFKDNDTIIPGVYQVTITNVDNFQNYKLVATNARVVLMNSNSFKVELKDTKKSSIIVCTDTLEMVNHKSGVINMDIK